MNQWQARELARIKREEETKKPCEWCGRKTGIAWEICDDCWRNLCTDRAKGKVVLGVEIR